MLQKINTNQRKKYIKLALILLAVAAVAYVAIFFVVDQRAKSAEKKEFLDNKAQIEEIAKKIVSVYPPSEEKHEESCRYQSAEFDRGDLYCGVSVNLTFKDVSIEKANEITDGASRVTGLSLRPDQARKDRTNKFIEPDGLEARMNKAARQSLSAELGFNPRSCTIDNYYDTGTQSDKKLLVSLTCKKVAKAEYFPVQKY